MMDETEIRQAAKRVLGNTITIGGWIKLIGDARKLAQYVLETTKEGK